MLAIENCLLRPLERIFTSQTIFDMDDAQVQRIAGEPSNVQLDRQRLTGELNKLIKGKQTLSAFNMDTPSLPLWSSLGMYPRNITDLFRLNISNLSALHLPSQSKASSSSLQMSEPQGSKRSHNGGLWT